MKKYLYILLSVVVLTIFAFIPHQKSLTGHWKAAYANGIKGNIDFRNNGTYLATFEGQQWTVGGKFKVKGDNVSVTDTVCGDGYWAEYKYNFLTEDSLKIIAITDSCTGRKANADGAVLVRIKH